MSEEVNIISSQPIAQGIGVNPSNKNLKELKSRSEAIVNTTTEKLKELKKSIEYMGDPIYKYLKMPQSEFNKCFSDIEEKRGGLLVQTSEYLSSVKEKNSDKGWTGSADQIDWLDKAEHFASQPDVQAVYVADLLIKRNEELKGIWQETSSRSDYKAVLQKIRESKIVEPIENNVAYPVSEGKRGAFIIGGLWVGSALAAGIAAVQHASIDSLAPVGEGVLSSLSSSVSPTTAAVAGTVGLGITAAYSLYKLASLPFQLQKKRDSAKTFSNSVTTEKSCRR